MGKVVGLLLLYAFGLLGVREGAEASFLVRPLLGAKAGSVLMCNCVPVSAYRLSAEGNRLSIVSGEACYFLENCKVAEEAPPPEGVPR